MDVKNLSDGKFLITIGPTQSKMLNEIGFKDGKDSEKVLADLVFCGIATEHSDMKLKEIIALQTEFRNH